MRQLFLILLLGCTACTSVAEAPRKASPPASSTGAGTAEALPQQIKAMIGSAACTDSSQCRTLPMGASACGGPQAYLAWSNANVSEGDIRALGERYTAQRQAQVAASGERSICRFVPDPGAQCVTGSCQLRAGSAPEAR
jgi:hypothetical protein